MIITRWKPDNERHKDRKKGNDEAEIRNKIDKTTKLPQHQLPAENKGVEEYKNDDVQNDIPTNIRV